MLRVRLTKALANALLFGGAALLVTSALAEVVSAAPTGPDLGTAKSFGVLAGSGVTNTGTSTVGGDLGTCPTPAITGFPPGIVGGTVHANDATACGAQSDLTIAYNDAEGRARTADSGSDLGGQTLVAGVYGTGSSIGITGTVTFDGAGDADSTFIIQAGTTLITATNSAVSLINGAQACNVFWQVGSSATLGVGTRFKGTVMALSSITANTSAVVEGRLLARTGAVTLDSTVITLPTCTTAPTTTTAVPTTTGPTPTTAGPTPTTAGPTSTTAGPTPTTSATTPTTVAGTPTTTTSTTVGVPTSTTVAMATTTTMASTTTTAGAPVAPTPSPSVNPPSFDLARVTVLPLPGTATTLRRVTTTASLPRTGGVPAWSPLAGMGAIALGALLLRTGRSPVRSTH